jgi:hypothetical protein
MRRSSRPPGGGAPALAASSGDGPAAMSWSAGTACEASRPFVGRSRVACGRWRGVGHGACDACGRCPRESRCSSHTRSSGAPGRVDGRLCRGPWRERRIGRTPGNSVQRRRDKAPRAQRGEGLGQASASLCRRCRKQGSARPPSVANGSDCKKLDAWRSGYLSGSLAGRAVIQARAVVGGQEPPGVGVVAWVRPHEWASLSLCGFGG